ncbi:MAG: inositol-3-phosphate synthase [Pacificimonas sp.]
MTERVGVAIVGVGGAVATTAIAGIEMLKAGTNDRTGLPLADRTNADLPGYENLVFGGWDLSADNLGQAALTHGVIGERALEDGAAALNDMRPWKAVGSKDFCAGIDGDNLTAASGHREAVELIQSDLEDFRVAEKLDRVVLINLASTERIPDMNAEALQSIKAFERGLDDNDANLSPAMLYAYAAIDAGIPFANFTPSVAGDARPLADLAKKKNVPIAGKDGKTGQTFMKTVIAPALRARSLHVDGWFSTNILGNRDGLALDDPKSLASKLGTKTDVLNQMLGYEVKDHIVMIHYYPPRGDDKEAWDNIDITGFMGQKMQLKLNFLCKDSVLAAPLVVEIARCLDRARQRGEGGVLSPLGVFFKSPQSANGEPVEHGFTQQQAALNTWLDS